jgi:hypothetical protein
MIIYKRNRCIAISLFIAFFGLLSPFAAVCQQAKIDSLLRNLPAKKDSVRVWKLLDIANLYLRSDSNQVKKYTTEALTLSKTLQYGRGEARSYAIFGELSYYNADLDKSEYWFDFSIERVVRY